MQNQVTFVNCPEDVSCAFVGSRSAGIVDGQATIATDNRVVLYVWYDNEAGYSAQVIRLSNEMSGVNYAVFPKTV